MEPAVETKEEIVERLRRRPEDLRRLGVRRVGLFGSFLHETQHAESDVDVLVEFEPGQKTFERFMELSFLLEELLGRRVEVITTESLSPYIGPRILKEVEHVEIGR